MLIQPIPLQSATVKLSEFGRVKVEIFDRLDGLEACWNALQEDGVCSLYQDFEWVKRWTELVSIHARMRPRLVIVRVESECLMILPLALRKRGPFTIAGWLGDSHSNYHMGLYARPFLQKISADSFINLVNAITDQLEGADILELCCQPVDWQGYTNPFTHLDWQESHNPAFALNLEGGFEQTLNRINGSRKRKKYRWQTNKLKDVDGPHLHIATTEKEVDTLLDVAFEQMAHRFNRAGIWNRFNDKGVTDFMRSLAKSSLGTTQPTLMVYGLSVDGKIRATMAGGISVQPKTN